jgi:hypothetical protein
LPKVLPPMETAPTEPARKRTTAYVKPAETQVSITVSQATPHQDGIAITEPEPERRLAIVLPASAREQAAERDPVPISNQITSTFFIFSPRISAFSASLR